MAMTISVDIVSTEERIFAGEAEMVFAPAEMGDVGIMPRHTPFLSPLKPGEVRIKNGDNEDHYFVSGGILEVQPHMVSILADTAIRAKDLDEAKALEAKQRAEEAMSNANSDTDIARAQMALAESMAQLQMISKLRDKLRAHGY
jgi:F-type H+-transporting ATPase subunit epsilon